MTDRVARAADRRNFAILLIDSSGWPLGMSFISMTTILPMFLQSLGASNVLIGMIPAIASLGSYFPQILIANRLESMPVKKRHVVWVGLAERLPHLLIVPFIMASAVRAPGQVIVAFFVLWAVSWVAQGFNLPAYFAVMAKVIGPDRRGRLFGYGGAIGGVLGLVGAWGAGLALTRLPFPVGYAVCFGLAFTILTASLLPIGVLNEPHCAREGDEPTFSEYMRRCMELVRGHQGLRRYILLQVLISMGMVAAAFFTVHSLRNLGATTAQVALFNGLGLAVTTLANLAGGPIADAMGHKKMTEWSVALLGASALVALSAAGVWAMYGAFALYTLAAAGLGISGFMLLLDFTPPTEVPTYTAITSTISSPFRFAAPILAGWLADSAGYGPVFAASAAACLVGFVVVSRYMD